MAVIARDRRQRFDKLKQVTSIVFMVRFAVHIDSVRIETDYNCQGQSESDIQIRKPARPMRMDGCEECIVSCFRCLDNSHSQRAGEIGLTSISVGTCP